MDLVATLKSLPLQRQLAVGAAVFAVFAIFALLARGAVQPSMALLYSGLSPETAGGVLQALDERGVRYEIRAGSIFVPNVDRDRLRFALAGEGLPEQSIKGYELLDQVNSFAVTSEMYNAAYWRAKEGELTRTILAIPGITAARVHVGGSLRSGFSRARTPNSASVTLQSSRELNRNQAEAIQYLVALAISGLAPEDVAVIEPEKGILAGPGEGRSETDGAGVEDRASLLEQKILRLLEARVGIGNARVSVSLDISRERRRISAVAFDPDSRVLRSRTVRDESEDASGGEGALTVASNLPQAGEQAGGGRSSTRRNSSETSAFEVNETRTETEVLPGDIDRLSVAVLINADAVGFDPAVGAPAQPVLDQLNDDFSQLIASAIGFSAARGDEVTIELMPFAGVETPDLISKPGMTERLLERHAWPAVQILALAIVAIILAFGVVRPLTARPAPSQSRADEPQGDGVEEMPDQAPPDPFDYLRDYAGEREDDTAALLRDWLNEDRKVAANE